ncbi:hypothetical protein K438DRAFT_1962130 [Mycena galopus ATCC 62051]|nr:hypothetical protein K438DRAFT_1962130 [Mycena galopus ATCC 62051]
MDSSTRLRFVPLRFNASPPVCATRHADEDRHIVSRVLLFLPERRCRTPGIFSFSCFLPGAPCSPMLPHPCLRRRRLQARATPALAPPQRHFDAVVRTAASNAGVSTCLPCTSDHGVNPECDSDATEAGTARVSGDDVGAASLGVGGANDHSESSYSYYKTRQCSKLNGVSSAGIGARAPTPPLCRKNRRVPVEDGDEKLLVRRIGALYHRKTAARRVSLSAKRTLFSEYYDAAVLASLTRTRLLSSPPRFPLQQDHFRRLHPPPALLRGCELVRECREAIRDVVLGFVHRVATRGTKRERDTRACLHPLVPRRRISRLKMEDESIGREFYLFYFSDPPANPETSGERI